MDILNGRTTATVTEYIRNKNRSSGGRKSLLLAAADTRHQKYRLLSTVKSDFTSEKVCGSETELTCGN